MQQNNVTESLIATIVIVVAIAFLGFAFVSTGTGSLSNYEIDAHMTHADGVSPGTAVEIAGVKIGVVRSLSLDTRHYFVTLRLAIRQGIAIPRNSRLSVSGGTLGSSYLVIAPGNAPAMVPPGGMLR
jgi:phospholipid/cholesterol/gamma-HCH transport system substrate-binding protein